ncbi:hypothetical protein BgiBS90_000256, partial [Biomphalaria glabrata]
DHETQESEGGETDLHKYLVGCKKNPGHGQFIPIDTFTLRNLPDGLQYNDLYKFIKVVADLIVRVDVKMVSPKRSQFWPSTKQPYPFFNRRDTQNLRTGSGKLMNVNKIRNVEKKAESIKSIDCKKCWCRKCKDSESPSTVWWEFDLVTATQVVFDNIEANYTSFRLFYNRDDSPVVSVDTVINVEVSIIDDLYMLKCVLCDKKIGNKLSKLWKRYINFFDRDLNKYFNSKQELNFIVSHPHGCSKQISVGYWKNDHMIGGRFRATYTTCSCPGSSGAVVESGGFRNLSCFSHSVHCGSLCSGQNYCGIGTLEFTLISKSCWVEL